MTVENSGIKSAELVVGLFMNAMEATVEMAPTAACLLAALLKYSGFIERLIDDLEEAHPGVFEELQVLRAAVSEDEESEDN